MAKNRLKDYPSKNLQFFLNSKGYYNLLITKIMEQ